MVMTSEKENSGSGLTLNACFNVFDDPEITKTVDIKINVNEFIMEVYPNFIKNLTLLVPEYSSIVIKGDFVILSNKQIRYLKREAALKHLMIDLFPRIYGLGGKSTIQHIPTDKQVQEYADSYYKLHGVKRYANMSAREIELREK